MQGIFKVDETNRPVYLYYDLMTCVDVLHGIDEYSKSERSNYPYRADSILLTNRVLLYHGWPYDDLPDFEELLEQHRQEMYSARQKKIRTVQTKNGTEAPAQNAQPSSATADETNTAVVNSLSGGDESPKTKISRDHVICGLILLIEGKLGEVQIPMPELEIRKFFEKTYPEVTGCSENHLRKVFKDALAHSHSGFGIPHESVDSGRPKK
jgi:hypothetical protein